LERNQQRNSELLMSEMDDFTISQNGISNPQPKPKPDETDKQQQSLTKLLKKIYRHTDQMRYRFQQDAYKECAKNEWFLVASLIDKILFFIYF